jgi:predicted nuclease with TOPRIM domain
MSFLPFRFGFDATELKALITQFKEVIMEELQALKDALAAQNEAITVEIGQVNEAIDALKAEIAAGQMDKEELLALADQVKEQTSRIEGIFIPPEPPPEEPPEEPPVVL